ncbi:uncharacterized protein LOC132201275 isoform X1 [Neocloeon triangulifer]|uniref:uncharacterized protein LOC132201275 isoform X1 n=1 Tax=Neocloeon triangulifer TaxID=2078957 RepID=UPI00286FA43C|nr:uncharacterized protein LOC132201275 isoform X1 [Neocloeon triangulifer]
MQVEDKYSAAGRADYIGGSVEHRLGQNPSHSPTERGLQWHDVPIATLDERPFDEGAGHGSRRRVSKSLSGGEKSASLPGAPRRQTHKCHSAESPVISFVVANLQTDLAYLDLAGSYQQRGSGKMQAERSARRNVGRNDRRVPSPEQGFCPRKRPLFSTLTGSGSSANWSSSCSSCRRCGNWTCPGHYCKLGKSRRTHHSGNHVTSTSVNDQQGDQIHSESFGFRSGCVGSLQASTSAQDHNILEVNISEIHDEYFHPNVWLVYTPQNVPGPGCPINFDEVFEKGCFCQDSCSSANVKCLCLSRHGLNYTRDGLIINYENPIFECHVNCKCEKNECSNRVVQRGPMLGLEVYETGTKGLGLRTSHRARKGQFICEYAGEVLGLQEAIRRAQVQGPQNNYILFFREHSGTSSTTTIIDPTFVGNIGRYANHSCDPSALMVPVRSSTLVPHLALFAARDLEVGEEITFDYAAGETKPSLSITPCRCASGKCRSFLPWDPSL